MKILIKGGRVIDPSQGLNDVLDILVEGDKISLCKKNINTKVSKTINAKGKVVAPGFVDIHTHLREPGEEGKETIATGTKAAAKGGVTSLCCMPNTKPVIDNAGAVEYVLLKAEKEGLVNVFPVGCITKSQQGEELAEIGRLKKAGVVAVSDDGKPVMNSNIMRRALEYCKIFDMPVISHSEDLSLSLDGVMNEGKISTLLGLRGIPRAAEEVIVARDIILAESTGGYIHIAHVSTKGSVELIRNAKARGVNLTCETAPHYFTLTDEAVEGYNTNAKMNPPLRTKEDVKAIKKGLKDGTIDCIASDHAPHTAEEKNKEFDLAPFGIIGLETMFALAYQELVVKNKMPLIKVIEKLSTAPANIVRLKGRGSLKPGNCADITIIDLSKKLKVSENIESKSKNTPFLDWEIEGLVTNTIVNGKVVY